MCGWYDETHTHACSYTDSDVEMHRLGCVCNFLAKTLKRPVVLLYNLLFSIYYARLTHPDHNAGETH